MPDGIAFSAAAVPSAAEIAGSAGRGGRRQQPNAEGSSVGLWLAANNRAELSAALGQISAGGVARGAAHPRGGKCRSACSRARRWGSIEVRPHSGIYDYASKYTKGMTDYLAPAPLEPAVTAAVRAAAEGAFAACGAREYARVDFILSAQDEPFLLEINTLPGMKETSLLPMSALRAAWGWISSHWFGR